MTHLDMSIPHQTEAPWEWPLAHDSVRRLPAAALPRWLQVNAGEVWLTGGRPGAQAEDVWLAAGERHALPAGTEWLLQGWPRARVALIEGPPAGPGAAGGAAATVPASLSRTWHAAALAVQRWVPRGRSALTSAP